ncbi:hypothetical protein ABTQ23_15970, partial [Celerinatantimonas sp. MCCC 1A17872]
SATGGLPKTTGKLYFRTVSLMGKWTVTNIYFDKKAEKPIESQSIINKLLNNSRTIITKIMNMVCPQRWLIRLLLAAIFSVILITLIISIWYYPLRKWVMSFTFSILSSLAIIILMLSIIADPYFSEFQVPISLGFIIFIGVILIFIRTLNKEGDKP